MSTTTTTDLDSLGINTIRNPCVGAGQKENSGRPGPTIGVAPGADTFWPRSLRFDPSDPLWPNRGIAFTGPALAATQEDRPLRQLTADLGRKENP